MSWKEWSYTKRGVVIGIVVAVIFVIISATQIPACNYCNQHTTHNGNIKYQCSDFFRFISCFPLMITFVFAWIGCGVESTTSSCVLIATIISIFLESLILGFIIFGIGWIVEKIKSRKK